MPQTWSVDFEQKIISAKISFARNEEHQRTWQWVTNFIRTLIWEHGHCFISSLLFLYLIWIIMLSKFCDRFVSFVMISDLWELFWHGCLVNIWKRFSQILLPHAESQNLLSNLPLNESYKTHSLKIHSRERYFKSFKTQLFVGIKFSTLTRIKFLSVEQILK